MIPALDTVRIRSDAWTILDPLERKELSSDNAHRSLAKRKKSLKGQVLAVIDNGAGARFRPLLVERLKERFGLADVILVIKDTVNVPPRPEDWAEVVKRGTIGLALYGA